MKFAEDSKLTTIYKGAFRNNPALKNIALPESVTSIGRYVFQDCSGLETITLPSGITSIEQGTFRRCTSLKDIVLPEKLEIIKKEAFDCCISLNDIKFPDTLKRLTYRSFANCTGLTSVALPELIERVEIAAFIHCDSLESMRVPISARWYNSQGWRWYNQDIMPKLSTYIFTPGTGEGMGYRSSYGPATLYYSCTPWYITRDVEGFNVTFEEGIKHIGNSMMKGSTINEVTIPSSVETMGTGVFSDNWNLETVAFADGSRLEN